MTALARFRSPVGTLAVEASEAGVCAVRFGGGERARPPIGALAHGHVEAALRALEDYFAGRRPELPALDLRGSPFQKRVWGELLRIPYGEVRTYGEIAAILGYGLRMQTSCVFEHPTLQGPRLAFAVRER